MASMIICRRAPMAKLLEKLLNQSCLTSAAAAPSQSASRFFNSDAQMRESDTDDKRSLDLDRRSDQARLADDFPGILSGVLDPFNPTRSLSQMLNLMDQMMNGPFPASARGMGSGARRGWDAREDASALRLRIDMPGLGKEHVRVSAEQNTLIIRGEGEKEAEDEAGRRYSSRIDLPEGLYKMDQIKAEMKNGVLKVVVPKVKVKEEERKDVFQVTVE